MRLEDKSIVVTGASGIAAAGARKVATEGARIFLISLGEEESRVLANEVEAVGYAAVDLSVEAEATAAFSAAEAALGSFDGLFAVAGGSGRGFGDGPADEIPLEGWEATFRINASPMFLAVRETLPRMRQKGGSIVLVSSVLADRPVPDLFATHAYAAAKGATNSFAVTTAAYYASDRIRVNAVAPGLVRTPMAERAANDPETVAYAARKQPLASDFLDPVDIANAAVFLLSDEAAQITGQVIAVDGGWSVTET